MEHIPVALATDNNCIPLVVAVASLLTSAGKDTFYDIYVLVDEKFLPESQSFVEECLNEYNIRFSLSFVNVGHTFDNAPRKYVHITRPTFYRLALPDLLCEEKCVYLDTDTIVRVDLQEYYHLLSDDCYVAGVRHPGYILSPNKDVICQNAQLPDIDQYINAGVMVMNLKQLRKDDMVSRFLSLIPCNMPTMDQDIINSACYGKMTFVPWKYNVMTQCAEWSIEDYKGLYTSEELREAWNEPCIIHYASPAKPWNAVSCVFMDYWWEVYRKNSVLQNIIHSLFRELPINAVYHALGPMYTKRVPKIFDMAYKRKYVIYGAGKRAHTFLSFMKQNNIIPEFIVVSDMAENPLEIEGIAVKTLVEACEILYDKTIIIAVREGLHKIIIRNLHKYDYRELLPVSDYWNG